MACRADSSSTHFALSPYSNDVKPVVLPPAALGF
jgi:hypothetical protein